MKKYWLITTTLLKEYFAYRLNFVLWRLRNFVSILIPIFLWQTVFFNNQALKNHTVAYFLLLHLISGLIISTTTTDLAGQIQNGEIINLLLKPISVFKYYFFRDLGDKLINFFFAIIETGIIINIVKIPFFNYLNLTVQNIVLFLLFAIIGFFSYFFISLLLSFVGFVSPEVWAPRFIFFTLLTILSGFFIPLDFLPKPLFNLLFFTPFPYFIYLPTKIITGNFNFINLKLALFGGIFWLFFSYFLVNFAWHKGLKSFSFWGK
ncbi:MAG: ABC transporter permease [Microgenomates group bacterium]